MESLIINGLPTPVIAPIPQTSNVKLLQPFEIAIGGGRKAVVPEGFVSDLASVPRVFRFWISTSSWLMVPAIVHDYLLRHDKVLAADAMAYLCPLYAPPNSGELGARIAKVVNLYQRLT